MGRLQEEYNKLQSQDENKKKIYMLNIELKTLENIAKSGMIDEAEKTKLRKKYIEIKKEIEVLNALQ